MSITTQEQSLEDVLQYAQVAYAKHLEAIEAQKAAEQKKLAERDNKLQQSIRDGLAEIMPPALAQFAGFSDNAYHDYRDGTITIRIPNHAPFLVMGHTFNYNTEWEARKPTDIRVPDGFDPETSEITDWERFFDDVLTAVGYCAKYHETMQAKVKEAAARPSETTTSLEEAINRELSNLVESNERNEAGPAERELFEALMIFRWRFFGKDGLS